MRVAFILMDFPVKSETFVLRDIDSLNEKGEEVSVFTLLGPIKARSYNGIDINVNLESIRLLRSVQSLIKLTSWVIFVLLKEKRLIEKLKLIYLAPRCLKLAYAIDTGKYDVVHLYWGHYPSLVGLMLRDRAVASLISLFLGAYDLEKNLEVSKVMSAQADIRWTHAKGNLIKLARADFPLSNQFMVNYRSLKIQEDGPQQTPMKLRKYDFITVSRLIEEKGIMEALRAVNELNKEGIPFKYAIVGEGPLKDQILSYIQRHGLTSCIDFYGYLPIEGVFSLMQNSRNFILLSEKVGECLPNVIKEALMHKCYILTGNSDCIRELIPNKKVGIIVDRFDHKKIVTVLKDFLDGKIAQDISYQEGLIRHKFDIEWSSKKYISEWSKLGAK